MHILNDPSFFLTNKIGAPQGEELGLMKHLSKSSGSCSDNSFISDRANRYGARVTGAAPGIRLVYLTSPRQRRKDRRIELKKIEGRRVEERSKRDRWLAAEVGMLEVFILETAKRAVRFRKTEEKCRDVCTMGGMFICLSGVTRRRVEMAVGAGWGRYEERMGSRVTNGWECSLLRGLEGVFVEGCGRVCGAEAVEWADVKGSGFGGSSGEEERVTGIGEWGESC
ncbi:hypothetical protein Tco_1072364 [Tanacetum coccineum]